MINLVNVSIEFLNEISIEIERKFAFDIVAINKFQYSLREFMP